MFCNGIVVFAVDELTYPGSEFFGNGSGYFLLDLDNVRKGLTVLEAPDLRIVCGVDQFDA